MTTQRAIDSFTPSCVTYYLSLISAFFGLALFGLLVQSPPAHAIAVTQDEQLAAMRTILGELRDHYGMIEFKKELLGPKVDYTALDHKYSQLIREGALLEEASGLAPKIERPGNTLSSEEFEQLMIGLAAEFQDGHTNIWRQSRNFWSLGISTAEVQGKLYVTGFNPNLYIPGSSTQEVRVGDEVIAINGTSVEELAQRKLPYAQLATYRSRWSWAMESLLQVSHRFSLSKKAGETVEVRFRRGTGSQAKEFSGRYPWINSKDLADFTDVMDLLRPERKPGEKPPFVYGGRGDTSYFARGLEELKLPVGAILDLGSLQNDEIRRKQAEVKAKAQPEKSPSETQSFPFERNRPEKENPQAEQAGANDEVQPITRLKAWIIQHKGKRFGYIRIPDYSPPSFSQVEQEYRWLGTILEKMENSTDGLIIDQLSNGGGYVYSVILLARLFANQGKLQAGQINIKLSRTFIASQESGKDYNTDPDNNRINFAKIFVGEEQLKYLKERFESGERWSGFVPHMGTTPELTPGKNGEILRGKYNPYSKPILFLNDNRSASGGDFMPSILQANRRVTLFGDTSMGLGGPVYRSQASMPISEMTMRCTYGLCVRADGLYMENVGAVPEIQRQVRPGDLSDNFKQYSQDALDAAALLLSGETPEEIQAKILKGSSNADPSKKPDFVAAQKAIRDQESSLRPEAVSAYFEFLETQWRTLSKDSAGLSFELSLPGALRSLQDPVLPTVQTRAAVLARLKEMVELPKIQKDKSLVAWVEGYISGLEKLSKTSVRIHFQQLRCKDLLAPSKGAGSSLPSEDGGDWTI